jgi:hypothetical protein
MPVPFSGTFTPDDLRRALALRRTPMSDPNTIIFAATTLVFSLLLLIGLFLNLQRFWAFVVIALLFGAFMYVSGKLSALANREQWVMADNLHSPHTGTADGEALDIACQQCKTHYQWGAFRYHIIKEDMVVLLMGAVNFIFLPRSFFADEAAWNTFTSLVAEKTTATLPTTWRPAYARLNALWVTGFLATMLIGLAVYFSI